MDSTKTINITSNEGNRCDPLERIGPDQAERILGLRIPLLGSMTHEFKYRVKQRGGAQWVNYFISGPSSKISKMVFLVIIEALQQ